MGRFLSADTIVPNPFNPQDLNRFSYVRNNPLRYVDPTGHRVCDDFDSVGNCITAPPQPNPNPTPNPTPSPIPSPIPSPVPSPTPSPIPSPTPSPTQTPSPTYTPPVSTGTPPPFTQQPPPNWGQIAKGTLILLGVVLLVDIPLVIGLASIPEVEATMVFDAVVTGVPIFAVLHDVHAYGLNLIIEGFNGPDNYFDIWFDPKD